MAERSKCRFGPHGVWRQGRCHSLQPSQPSQHGLLSTVLAGPTEWSTVQALLQGTVHAGWAEMAAILFEQPTEHRESKVPGQLSEWFRRHGRRHDGRQLEEELILSLCLGERGEAARLAQDLRMERLAVLICCHDPALMAQQLACWETCGRGERIRPLYWQCVRLLAGEVAACLETIPWLPWEACLAAFWHFQRKTVEEENWRERLASALLAYEEAFTTRQQIAMPASSHSSLAYQLLSLAGQTASGEAAHRLTLRQGMVHGERLLAALPDRTDLLMPWIFLQLISPIRPPLDPACGGRVARLAMDSLILAGRPAEAQLVAQVAGLAGWQQELGMRYPSPANPMAMAQWCQDKPREQFEWLWQAGESEKALHIFAHHLAPDLILTQQREQLAHYAECFREVHGDEWTKLVLDYARKGMVPQVHLKPVDLKLKAALSVMRGALSTRGQYLRTAQEQAISLLN